MKQKENKKQEKGGEMVKTYFNKKQYTELKRLAKKKGCNDLSEFIRERALMESIEVLPEREPML